MTAPTDQFVDITKRSQEAVTAAVRTWTEALQNHTGAFTGGQPALPTAHAVVDNVFDFAQQVLADQRELAKVVTTAGTQAAEAVTARTVDATESLAATVQRTARAARNGTKI